MGDTSRMDPFTVEFCDRRVEQLKGQKRKVEKMLAKKITEQADSKGRKKSRKEIKSLQSKLKDPETRKKLVGKAGLEDAKKHAREINSLESTIKFMEMRKKCIIMAAERSITLEAAQKLLKQEEKLKSEKQQQQVKAAKGKKPVEVEQPAGEDSPESTINEASPLPPPVHRRRPCPEGCDLEEYEEWVEEFNRVEQLNAAVNNLPTQTRGHKDPTTVAAVVDPDDKMKLINVAKAIVSVSFPVETQDPQDSDGFCTGIIVGWGMDNNTARILTFGCLGYNADDDSKNKIFVHWPYKEDDGLIEAKLLFFSKFYQLCLLEVAFQGTLLGLPTQIPSFGLSAPGHGDEIFALGRDKDLSLVVRRGTISQEQPLDALRQGYLFVDFQLPECNTGGPVVDHDGNVVGLAIPCDEGISAILPISTALSCLDMWTKFGRIARPLLGMSFMNVKVLDDLSGDIKFDGLVVHEVNPNSAAWKHRIRSGSVIVSLDEQSPKPLAEFEGVLLSHGSRYLHGACTEVDFKLEVQDAPGVRRSITLHVPFSDVANVRD